jgi:endonuclease/exonuclease/phosphatase (EEP) superfamily protein YafD
MTRLKSAIVAVIDTAALALGCGCLAASLLAQAGRVARPFDVLAHFAPFWLLGGLACALCGAALAKGMARRRLLTVGALAFVAAAALLAPEALRRRSAPAAADAPERIRLIQFNAWELNHEPEAAAQWIAGEKPDVVAVEEVSPALRSALERRGFRGEQGLNKGIAIFSRSARARDPFMVPLADWPLLPEFARASFPAPRGDGTFSVVAVHLRWPTRPHAWRQTLRLADFLGLYDSRRLILVGDFNLTPWSFTLRQLDHRLGLERRDRFLPTWPAKVSVDGRAYAAPAFMPIDHVYAGAAWRTIRVRQGPSMGSDHYPLVVDLALTPQATGFPASRAIRAGQSPRSEPLALTF